MTNWNAETVDSYLENIHASIDCAPTHFSNSRCELCGGLPGDRHDWTGLDEYGNKYEGTCCTDCAMYLANGETPEED